MKIKLNLIPEQKKEEINQANLFRLILKWQVELFGIIMIFTAMLLSINYILKFTLASDVQAEAAKSETQYKEMENYDLEIREINTRTSQIEKIQKGQLDWFNFFKKINDQFSSSIEIKKIATLNYQVLLSGKANNRDNLISFKENMEKENCFSDVNLPLSNLVERNDVEFQIDFKIKKECLLQMHEKTLEKK